MEHTELYKILGVSKDSTDAEIKKNYRKLAKEFHPDKNPEAGDKFKEISFAYEILSDPEKRKVYDRYGLKGLQEGSEGASDAFEIFTHWFPFGSAHSAGPGTSSCKARAAAQVVVKLEVTLEEIFNGNVNKKVEYKRTSYCSICFGQGGPKEAIEKCEACSGTGRTATYSFVGTFMNAFDSVCRVCYGRGNTVKSDMRCATCSGEGLIDEEMERDVTVEKGAPNMLKIPFRGEGNQPQSGERGDLVVVLVQADHPVFIRRQNDLFLRDIRINLAQALCGYVHCFHHLDGRKMCITTRPGQVIRHGDMMMVSGEGMPLRNNPFERGDLYVEFRVDFPDSDFATAEQLALLEKLLPPRQHTVVPRDAEEVALSDTQPYGEGAHGGAHGGDDDEDGAPQFEGVQCQTA